MEKPRKKKIHPYYSALGMEVRKLRLIKGMSLETLGGEIGLDASNLQKIELGQNITLSTLLKICICLQTTPAKLFEKLAWNLTEKDIDHLTTPRTVKKKNKKLSRRRQK